MDQLMSVRDLLLRGGERGRSRTDGESSADGGDDVGDEGLDLVDGPALEQGLVVVVPADLSEQEQGARHQITPFCTWSREQQGQIQVTFAVR